MIRSLKRQNSFRPCEEFEIPPQDNFEEAAHLSSDGSFDMYEIIKALYDIDFPVDPAGSWPDDLGETAMPGYGLYDRALGAAYINGLWEAIEKGSQR